MYKEKFHYYVFAVSRFWLSSAISCYFLLTLLFLMTTNHLTPKMMTCTGRPLTASVYSSTSFSVKLQLNHILAYKTFSWKAIGIL